MKIQVETEVDVNALWEAVWGCDGKGMTYWSSKVRKPNGQDINLFKRLSPVDFVPNPQNFKVRDDIEKKWHLVTLEDLAKGYVLAKENNQKHCFTFDLDLEDYDACFGDMVIQYAIFEKLVYG
jgi:hypothetical protein